MQNVSSIVKQQGKAAGSAFSKKEGTPFFKSIVQPKLTINQPNDIYEQEADAVADKVMRMTVNENSQQPFYKPAVSVVQRKCAHCEAEENKLQRMMSAGEEQQEEETVQRKAADGKEVDQNLESRLTNLGGGQPLSASARSFFEPRFGQSFSDIKVHTGADADQAARSINAKAYTLGNHIAFASGEHDFSSDSGRRLMAHELTHTVQQSAGTKSVQRGSAGILGGKGCLRAPRVEWALVGAGVWKKLEQGQCTGTTEDADGMTCGGGFYHVDNLQTGTCSTPRNDDATFAPRRWTPSSAGASAHSPTAEGSTGGDTPPNYVYDSAATAACPNGVRTISVDLIMLDGSTVSPSAQLATANTVFSGCCVQFVAGATPPPESQATTQGWLGGDTDLQWDDTTNVTAEEQAMFDGATSNRGLSGRMRLFFVASLTPATARAYSIPPFRASGGQAAYVNHGVVSNSALTDTVAHELGHILIDSGAHTGIVNPADTTNLMFAPGRTGSNLDATQCATIYGNA